MDSSENAEDDGGGALGGGTWRGKEGGLPCGVFCGLLSTSSKIDVDVQFGGKPSQVRVFLFFLLAGIALIIGRIEAMAGKMLKAAGVGQNGGGIALL